MAWIRDNIIPIIILALMGLLILWAVGYVRNGEYGKSYELASCWAGLATLGSAGMIALLEFLINSKLNSKDGEKP